MEAAAEIIRRAMVVAIAEDSRIVEAATRNASEEAKPSLAKTRRRRRREETRSEREGKGLWSERRAQR